MQAVAQYAAQRHDPVTPRRQDKSSDKPKVSYWVLLKQTGADWMEDNCMRLSAALACYTVLSLAPLVVIVFKILSIVFRGPDAQAKLKTYLETQVQSLTGFSDTTLIDTIIQKSVHPGNGIVATSIGVIVLLFGASGVFGELQNSMNTIWEVKPRPNLGIWGFVRQRFLSMSMVIGIAFLLLVSLFISTALSTITTDLVGKIKIVGVVTDLIVSLGVVTLLFAMIFKLLPDVKIPWKYVWLGAFITALLFTVGKWALTLYFRFGAPTSAYGAFGSLAAVVIWVYYSSLIVFLGAEFTKVYARATGKKLEPTHYAVPLTEEARVQQGIPHEQTMWNAVARDNIERKGQPTQLPQSRIASDARTYVAAGAGVAIGVLGALGFANTTKNRVRREAAVMRLHERMNQLETRAGKAKYLRQDLALMRVAERMDEIADRIAHAASKARRVQRRVKPKTWTERIVGAVKQYV